MRNEGYLGWHWRSLWAASEYVQTRGVSAKDVSL